MAFLASWFITELPMRTTVTTEGIGEAFGSPRSPDSLAEIARALSVLIGRKRMLEYLRRLTTEAGVDLPLADGWVLVQLRRNPSWDRAALLALAHEQKISAEDVDAAERDVVAKGLLTKDLQLTPTGTEIADRLRATLRARLEVLLDGWSPEQYPDLVRLLDQFSAEIVTDPSVVPAASAGALST